MSGGERDAKDLEETLAIVQQNLADTLAGLKALNATMEEQGENLRVLNAGIDGLRRERAELKARIEGLEMVLGGGTKGKA